MVQESSGFMGPRLSLSRLPGILGQHEEEGRVLPGDACHGDEVPGLLCGQGSLIPVRDFADSTWCLLDGACCSTATSFATL